MVKKIKAVNKEEIENALIKKALGYDSDEIVEEYVSDEEGNFKLVKKKVTKKYISPDITTAKVLLEKYESENNNIYESMSDEQLEQKKLELIKKLKEVK